MNKRETYEARKNASCITCLVILIGGTAIVTLTVLAVVGLVA
jgi:hypothetical protein